MKLLNEKEKEDLEFLDNWLQVVKPKLKEQFSGFIFSDTRLQYEFETIIRRYFDIKNRIIWIRKNMSQGRVVKDRFISSYEVIFFVGNRELNSRVFPDQFITCFFHYV